MLRAERHKLITELVNKKGIVAIEDLMREANISKATARREINYLAEENRLVKIRGGAKALDPSIPPAFEPSFRAKSMVNLEEKQRIAAAAKRHIQARDKVILDSGTTVLELAKQLLDAQDITVVTNDIRIASELTKNQNIDMLFVGGMIRKGFCSSYGYFAEAMLSDITVNKIFLSVDAIDSDFGIMSYTMDDVNVKKIGMANALQTILLCDHSKFSSRALFSIGSLECIDIIIVGKELDPALVSLLRQLGKTLELV